MDAIRIVRLVFQFIAFTVFLVQSYESLVKYFNYPIVEQKSEGSNQIEFFDLYICQNDQTNKSAMNHKGYEGVFSYFAGNEILNKHLTNKNSENFRNI